MTASTEIRPFDLLALRCAAGTDVGMRRDENQDAFGVIKHPSFQGFFVADGMGGVNGGAIASRLAISTLQELLPPLGNLISPSGVAEVVQQINTRIFEKGAAQPSLAGMGTTLVGLVFTPEGLIGVNVGDSRAYRIRGNTITQLSEDHTLVRELLRSGAISDDEASGHPVSHMLTRSLGPLSEVAVESRMERESPEEGDIYVLCSDGLYNFVQDQDILDVVRQNPLDDANQILINLANRRGGSDNITVLVISVGERRGSGRGNDYRSARSSSNPERSREGSSESVAERASGVSADASASPESQSMTPPQVEEPKDVHAERESLKQRKRRFHQPQKGIPMSLMIAGAVVFGLVVGDVARRFGAFPDISFITDSFSSREGAKKRESREQGGLDDLSRELALSRSKDSSKEGLPDIARRVLSEGTDKRPSVLGRDRSNLNRKALEGAAAKIEQRLATLARITNGDEAGVALLLQTAAKVAEQHQQDINSIETEVDAASRKLSLWFGRKKRLEAEGEAVLQAGGDLEKVAATSDVVRRKISEYNDATYRLQAKHDEFELYPSNDSLKAEVATLEATRSKLLRELRDEVTKVVDSVLAETYRQLEELKARRDIVAAQLQVAREDVELLQGLNNPDAAKRDELKTQMERELRDIHDALERG